MSSARETRRSLVGELALAPGSHRTRSQIVPNPLSTPFPPLNRSGSGSPLTISRPGDDTDATDPAKRARLQPSPISAPAVLALASSSEPPISPVVLGFQMSTTDVNTMRSAQLMKEQQQALILQRREEQKNAEGGSGKMDGVVDDAESVGSSSSVVDGGSEAVEAGSKRPAALGKFGGLSIRTTGAVADGGQKVRPTLIPSSSSAGTDLTTCLPNTLQSAPLTSQGVPGPLASARPPPVTTPYAPTYPAAASQAAYPLARSASASGAPVSASRTPSGSYPRAYPNGHVPPPLPSPSYQQHTFPQQPSSVRHPQPPYALSQSPPSPPNAHKATFLAPFEKFYDALLDSRTLQTSQTSLEHKTQDLHRQSTTLLHTLEEHHRRSVSVLNTLQISSSSLQDMVRKEVQVVREETSRELDTLRSRVVQLEEGFKEAGLDVPPPTPLTDGEAEDPVNGGGDGKKSRGTPKKPIPASAVRGKAIPKR